MKIRVHRTEIPIDDCTELRLRGYLRSIHVAPSRKNPHGALEIWYECTDIEDQLTVRFWVHGTGHPFTHHPVTTPHIGTVATEGGLFIWHVYAEYPLAEAFT